MALASRWHEQFGYSYNAAGNLSYRTNHALTQTFTVNSLNELTGVTRTGNYIVAGATAGAATNVAVTAVAADRYSDWSFARTNFSLSDGNNTFSNVAWNSLGVKDTNLVTAYLPAAPTLQYDLNGNLTNDGQRVFEYDFENQLTNVYAGDTWQVVYQYDAFGRLRKKLEYGWTPSGGTAIPLVTNVTTGTAWNFLESWEGVKLTVGNTPLTVTHLGRWVLSGNSQSHTVKLVLASTGANVSGGSVSVNTSGATANQFVYGALAAPITLNANTAYYLVSYEPDLGDQFLYTTVTTTSAATVNGAMYNLFAWPGWGGPDGGTGASYGPVSLKYMSGGLAVTNEVRYVYDGMLVAQERDSNNLARVTYTRGLDLSQTRQGAGGIGGLLARTEHANFTINIQHSTACYHHDGGGNITALISTNGLLLAKYSHDPFGQLLAAWGPMADANTYRFSSKEWHPLTGLYYYGFRFYEPSFQRWPNRDPIQEAGGINLYGMVGNSPVNIFDPIGLDGNYGNPVSGPNGPIGKVPTHAVPTVPNFIPPPPAYPPPYGDGWYWDPNKGTWYAHEPGILMEDWILFAACPVRTGGLKLGAKAETVAVKGAEAATARVLPPLRQQYVDAVRALSNKATELQNAGKSPEEIARALHAARRELGERFKGLTPPAELEKIYARNLERYGDKLGPSIEWLRAQGKSWEDIAGSACRAGGKDLGY